jgi:biopolymer transport protein ExbD
MGRRKHEEKEVDLAALVDILSNMLFFLLATVSFLQLKTLNAAVPALSTSSDVSTKAVNVTVEIKANGYVLKVDGESADPSVGKIAISREIPRGADGQLTPKELTKELWEVKKKTPETKNIMIFPEQGVVFEEIVKTMDASREMTSIVDPNKKVPLFSRPVLSELVTGDEAARDDVAPGTPGGPPHE